MWECVKTFFSGFIKCNSITNRFVFYKINVVPLKVLNLVFLSLGEQFVLYLYVTPIVTVLCSSITRLIMLIYQFTLMRNLRLTFNCSFLKLFSENIILRVNSQNLHVNAYGPTTTDGRFRQAIVRSFRLSDLRKSWKNFFFTSFVNVAYFI